MRRDDRGEQRTPEEIVSDNWAAAADPAFRARLRQLNWMGHPEVQRHVNRCGSGDPGRPWLDHVIQTYLSGRRIREVLNVGCGEGALERHLIARNFAESYVGYDLSGPCIARANATVARDHPRARFIQADVNRLQLPPAAFDVAFFSHAIHHVERLEHVCEQVRAALRPDGFLLVEEFIGPNRMQWTDRQLALVNRLLDQLPTALKLDLTRHPERVPKAPVERMSVAAWLRHDPSECVRSQDILRAVEASFEILERRDFGGTILQKLLENICGNFDPTNEDHSAIVRLLLTFESILIEEGIIGSDFTFLVARPRA